MKKMEVIFVYGTLRAGGSNHFRLGNAGGLGAGTVCGRLYRVDWYPALLLDADAGAVHGEVYEVDAATLAALDAFEGAEYRRVRVGVMPEGGGEKIDAWLWEYLDPVDESRRIPGGDWLAVALDD